jgi:hypothetical protein
MKGIALLLATVAVGIDYGWQPSADGELEYIVQIEPVTVAALAEGQQVISQIDPYVQNIRRFRLRVGTAAVPRQGSPPRQSRPSPDAARLLDNIDGVMFGWQPLPSGELEYLVQLAPAKLQALQRGEQIVGELAPQIPRIAQYRIYVGTGTPPRQNPAAAPAAVAANATTTGASTAGASMPLIPPPATRSPALNISPPANAGNAASNTQQPALSPPSLRASTFQVADDPVSPAHAAPGDRGTSVVEPDDRFANPALSTESLSQGSTRRSSTTSDTTNAANADRNAWRFAEGRFAETVANPNAPATAANERATTTSNQGRWLDGSAMFSPVPHPQVAQPPLLEPPSPEVVAAMLQWSRRNPPPSADDWAAVSSAAPAGNQANVWPNDRGGYDPRGAYISTLSDIPVTHPATSPYGESPNEYRPFALPAQPASDRFSGNGAVSAAGGNWASGNPSWGAPATNPVAYGTPAFSPQRADDTSGGWPNRLVSFDAEIPSNPAPDDFWARLAAEANDPEYAFLRSGSSETSDRPWPTLFWTVMLLFASIGGNFYLGWIATDIFRRFRDLTLEVAASDHRSRRREIREEERQHETRPRDDDL